MLSVNVCLAKFTRSWSLHDMFIALDGQGMVQETAPCSPLTGPQTGQPGTSFVELPTVVA